MVQVAKEHLLFDEISFYLMKSVLMSGWKIYRRKSRLLLVLTIFIQALFRSTPSIRLMGTGSYGVWHAAGWG